MQAVLKFYRQIHLEYLWLHFLVAVVLAFTSVFWFVLPYFMISYGQYTTTVIEQTFLLMALFVLPSIIITLHCWFINFQAALKLKRDYPHESAVRWVFRFQSMTIVIVVMFTSVIYTLLFIIDTFR